MKKRSLYPALDSEIHAVKTNSVHRLHVETSGNPSGHPVVFLHGGPGSSCNKNHRRYFNPDQYYIVTFDQRGCGQSEPAGELSDNTTQDLIADIERIRTFFGIDKWLVFGGSWGACLGLLYAQEHPFRVTGMILRGCFLARQQDLCWFAQHGASELFSEAWQLFIEHIPEDEQNDLVTAYYKRLHLADKQTQLKFASLWASWSSKVAMHNLSSQTFVRKPSEALVLKVRIETHYAYHRYFIAENQILNNIEKLPSVPITIVHGELDKTCLLTASQTLSEHVPQSELIVIPNTGHLIEERDMISTLVAASDQFINQL